MTTSKQYDLLNRLTSISNLLSAAGSSTVAYSYGYNAANQRIRRTEADGSQWQYRYDGLGQVTLGKKFWSDWTPVAGQQFEYAFDDIGNRTSTKAGGDEKGANLRPAGYTANNLNQYTSRDVPGAFDVIGLALATNAVTVNGQTPYRRAEYFRKEVLVDNTGAAVWQSVTVSSTNQAPVTGNVFVPKTQEQFVYDDDGNLVQDGHWNYGWDAENRLVALTNRASAAPAQVLHFEYDAKSRRVRKQVWNNGDGAGTPATDLRFAYDGWNLLGELPSLTSALRTYLWGLDLSGSLQGAGGIGGLLELTYYGTQTTNCFAAFDGNGNLALLANAADGTAAANYEFGPFGEVIRSTGPMAKANPFRFSTKCQDDETDLLCYPFRYYSASTGRWLSRDPAEEEQGGANLYGYVGNDAVRFIDALGLWKSGVWGTQHKDLTVNALNTALAQQNLSEACKSKIRDILVDANEGQDKGAAANEMFRHFNRKYIKGETPQEVTQGRANARREYAVYTMGEEISFYYIPDCWERLKALGRVSHSWQDYYAHGIHTSRGFVDPIGGSPTSFGEFWPSSYNAWNAWESGEHPNRAEPVEVSSRRYQQAEAYTALRFRRLLVDYWLPSCKCLCQ